MPAVASKVIELTSDDNVSMDDLAATIQNDQGLASKVLRTVNSSYYGLRQKCGTIRQSLVVLGLNAVKSISLGFSLVSCLKAEEDDGFDHQAYWRRGLYTAVGARSFALAGGSEKAEEAFLGGLLQDVGLFAMHVAIPDRIHPILREINGDHRQLSRLELERLDLTHADIGAMLTERWKLPNELVLPVRFHERPTAAPSDHTEIVRAVGVGNIVHDVMTDEDPIPALKMLYKRCKQWFDLSPADCDALLDDISKGASELSNLFKIDTGSKSDADAIRQAAVDRAAELTQQAPPVPEGSRLDSLVLDSDQFDPLTGLIRENVSKRIRGALFESAKTKSESLVVVRVGMSGIPNDVAETRDQHDNAVVGISALLRKHFEHLGGLIARRGETDFDILVPGISKTAATRSIEEFRAECELSSKEWRKRGEIENELAASIGVATYAEDSSHVFKQVEQVATAADRAVAAAKKSGGNCIRIFTPKAA